MLCGHCSDEHQSESDKAPLDFCQHNKFSSQNGWIATRVISISTVLCLLRCRRQVVVTSNFMTREKRRLRERYRTGVPLVSTGDSLATENRQIYLFGVDHGAGNRTDDGAPGQISSQWDSVDFEAHNLRIPPVHDMFVCSLQSFLR